MKNTRKIGTGHRESLESGLAIFCSDRLPESKRRAVPAQQFHVAEEYHQAYYKKSAIRYRLYRSNCDRDARVAKVWSFKN